MHWSKIFRKKKKELEQQQKKKELKTLEYESLQGNRKKKN